MKRMQYLTIPACAAVAILIGTLALAQSFDDPSNGNNNGQNANSGSINNNGDLLFPRARIVELGDRIVRLDTATGEISRFRGNLSGNNARGNFVSIAQPVSGQTSGFLQVQQVGNGIFLIDAVTGQTWILRQRNNSAAWIEVDVPTSSF